MQIVVIHTAALSAIEVITEPSALSVEQAVSPKKGLRMNQISKAKQVELAAFVFARITRDAETIATALDISVRTVQRLIHNDDFLAQLDRWGYKGELNFQVKPLRDRRKSPDYEKA